MPKILSVSFLVAILFLPMVALGFDARCSKYQFPKEYHVERGAVTCKIFFDAESYWKIRESGDQIALDKFLSSGRCSMLYYNGSIFIDDTYFGPPPDYTPLVKFRCAGETETSWTPVVFLKECSGVEWIFCFKEKYKKW